MAVTPESPAFPEREPNVGENATLHADHDAAAYQRGTMTINEQAATWSLFQKLAVWGTLISFCMALYAMLALAKPGGNIFGDILITVVVFVVGAVVIKTQKLDGHGH